MGRRSRRTATVLLMGAALSAAPLGIATIATPAIGNAACAPGEVLRPGGACATECVRGEVNRNGQCIDGLTAMSEAIDPDKSPGENWVNLANLPPMDLGSTPLIETSPLVEVPLSVGLPGIGLPGIGVNLWPDLSAFPAPAAPDLTGLAVPVLAFGALPPPPALGPLPPPPALGPLPPPPGPPPPLPPPPPPLPLPPPPWPFG